MAETNEIDRGDILHQWSFSEFAQYDRSRGWYIGFMLAVLGFGAYAVWAKNYTFLMIIVLLALILIVRFRRSPMEVVFMIREEGAQVSNRFYAWREMKDFWILYQPPTVKKLYLEFKTVGRPSLDIPMENQNPLKIRQLLSEHLVENTEREEEPFSDTLTRALKI